MAAVLEEVLSLLLGGVCVDTLQNKHDLTATMNEGGCTLTGVAKAKDSPVAQIVFHIAKTGEKRGDTELVQILQIELRFAEGLRPREIVCTVQNTDFWNRQVITGLAFDSIEPKSCVFAAIQNALISYQFINRDKLALDKIYLLGQSVGADTSAAAIDFYYALEIRGIKLSK